MAGISTVKSPDDRLAPEQVAEEYGDEAALLVTGRRVTAFTFTWIERRELERLIERDAVSRLTGKLPRLLDKREIRYKRFW
jgi:hypothetical protein